MYNILYVGIDDTDSSSGMCTTYICAVVLERLKDCGFTLKGEPHLIRLNPFAPYKTRGNGAVSFKLILKNNEEIENAKRLILSVVEKFSEVEDPRTNPGVVFYTGEITEKMKEYSLKTVRQMVTLEEAESLVQDVGAEIFKYKNGRGIIGALAAIGCPLPDETYELIAYRTVENYGKKRKIDENSVRIMDQKTYPETFDNVDDGYMTIEPHTPCPVLYGIRGESKEAVCQAHHLVDVKEPVERIMVFLTNQHTDLHIQEASVINHLEMYQCYHVKGQVKDQPHVIEGGHVIFTLKDASGEIECAAYEPTKGFRDTVRQLAPGDKLVVYGGIGKRGTLNLEKIQITHLEDQYQSLNPRCHCGKRMKSAGSGKGYKCPSCGHKVVDIPKEKIKIERMLEDGFYEVPPSARRHLSKPLVRILGCK
ncbi:MAG TPA: tRNA(Ile)(2)-agmatinylcytidine synthase [Methanobacteriaceae archaeon]|nr:tRNA(Ile)(2)-agmatinylcytidine synthase [Methanobacteriaceae archaeon]